MAIVYGQIESLTRIRQTLQSKGISRFNSIGDIDGFKKNYELEKQEIVDSAKQDLADEMNDLRSDQTRIQVRCDELAKEISTSNYREIDRLKNSYETIKSRKSNKTLINFINWVQCSFLKYRISKREKNVPQEITRKTNALKKRANEIKVLLAQYENNSDRVIALRCSPKLNQLAYTKDVIEGLSPLIAGAIGENLVDKELPCCRVFLLDRSYDPHVETPDSTHNLRNLFPTSMVPIRAVIKRICFL